MAARRNAGRRRRPQHAARAAAVDRRDERMSQAMFDLVHKHKRIAQFILALIMIPFAFFGVDYYFRSSGSVGEVAKFDGGKITEAEFANAIRDQQEQLRRCRAGRRSGDPRQSRSPLQSRPADCCASGSSKRRAPTFTSASRTTDVFDHIAADPALSARTAGSRSTSTRTSCARPGSTSPPSRTPSGARSSPSASSIPFRAAASFRRPRPSPT